ncbi:MAG: dihydropteroate synthase [Candidatus Nanopelagicales bacterium]|nr:dihydropteroate synthase [Candidatus Nanopelagicales bacterium]
MSSRHLLGLPGPLQGAEHTLVVGVLNVTPDSFSDGGRFASPQAAIDHGIALHAQGADFVDVGGESTRPGAVPVDAAQEQSRVLDVIAGLAAAGVPTSIDTMHASTAVAAVAAGCFLVNDVSGGLADPEMHAAVAGLGVPYVVMHWRGGSAGMQHLAVYDDVVTEVRRELERQVEAACAAGIAADAIVIDPGLGFAKDADHNWALLQQLDELVAWGHPVLVGASRKRFLGALLADGSGQPRDLAGRDLATSAVSGLAAAAGVWAVRVHDVPGSVDAVRVGGAWRMGRQ